MKKNLTNKYMLTVYGVILLFLIFPWFIHEIEVLNYEKIDYELKFLYSFKPMPLTYYFKYTVALGGAIITFVGGVILIPMVFFKSNE